MQSKKNISLGCGAKKEKGYIGLDHKDYGHNILWSAPDRIPIKSNSVDFAKAHNFFEHLNPEEIIPTINECWRVIKDSGVLEIKVPNGHNPEVAFCDPTHKSFWVEATFHYFTGERPQNADYGIKKWKLLKLETTESVIKAILRPKCILEPK